jgi:hypothetical protein
VAKGKRAGRILNVDLHPTAAHLLGIEPGAPVDGSLNRGLLE